MARGIFIRESDLDPLITVLGRLSTQEGAGMPLPHREALDSLLELVTDARSYTHLNEIQRDRMLRYEYHDDILAYVAGTKLREPLTGSSQ